MYISRRAFLKNAALVSALGVAPRFLTRAAEGAVPAIEGFKDERILVVVQLGGGNDGLNTLVPYADDTYYRLRPRLGLKKDRLIPINDELAFNDRLADLMRVYESGRLAVVQGVGYPNPDRSHFRSMEIWHTASDADAFLSAGWIGRYFDNCCSGSARPQVGVALGKERPQAFEGAKGYGVAFENPLRFGWLEGKGYDSKERFEAINKNHGSTNDTLDFLRHTTSNAIKSSDEVREAARTAGIKLNAGRGQELQTIAALIRAGLSTRIYFASVSGFDTHANQLNQHDNLLAALGTGLHQFQQTLTRDGTADRVLTLVFSEFGRRVGENASGGTDHGTAAPMFLMGHHVTPGLHGQPSSLADLESGDLKYSTDFRSVYASVLEDWFAVESARVLGRSFDTLPLLA
jgi:uncharacterized protein (DUF1501 family)